MSNPTWLVFVGALILSMSIGGGVVIISAPPSAEWLGNYRSEIESLTIAVLVLGAIVTTIGVAMPPRRMR